MTFTCNTFACAGLINLDKTIAYLSVVVRSRIRRLKLYTPPTFGLSVPCLVLDSCNVSDIYAKVLCPKRQKVLVEELELTGLRIETIEPLRPLINLLDLNLAFSEHVRDIKAIEAFPNLKVLILTGCAGIQDLGPATAHPTLEYFRNTRGEKVTTNPLGKSS